MNKVDILNKASRTFYKTGFKLKKHSPTILAVAGTVGVVTSGVMACRATTKLSTIIDEHHDNVDEIHDYIEENGFSDKYTEKDSNKDLTIVYTQTGVKLVKLYAPSVILGTISLAAMLGSNHILRKRNIALTAAYTTAAKTFRTYRDRVVDRFGEGLDEELRYGIKTKEIEETVTDEKGKEKKVKKTVDVVNIEDIDGYSRLFYEGNPGWDDDPRFTRMFLLRQLKYANMLLKKRGYLTLNEVYKMLGFSLIPDGQIMGWFYDEEHPNTVDFGILDTNDEMMIRFFNGDEKAVLLKFNINGNILDKIK